MGLQREDISILQNVQASLLYIGHASISFKNADGKRNIGDKPLNI
jgi:hypothetical protein